MKTFAKSFTIALLLPAIKAINVYENGETTDDLAITHSVGTTDVTATTVEPEVAPYAFHEGENVYYATEADPSVYYTTDGYYYYPNSADSQQYFQPQYYANLVKGATDIDDTTVYYEQVGSEAPLTLEDTGEAMYSSFSQPYGAQTTSLFDQQSQFDVGGASWGSQ